MQIKCLRVKERAKEEMRNMDGLSLNFNVSGLMSVMQNPYREKL